MFEATIEVVLEKPITVLALLPVLYLTARAIWSVRTRLAYVAGSVAAVGLLPVFVLFTIGEFTRSSTWMDLGSRIFQFEAAIVAGVVQLYDALLAAWLRVFALVLDALLTIRVFQPEAWVEAVQAVLPGLTGFQLWLSAFALHFAGGAVLVYVLYRGTRTSSIEPLLRGAGVTFVLAGLFVTLLQERVVEFGHPVVGVLLVAVLGLEMGVAAVLLWVKPNFTGIEAGTDLDRADITFESVRDSLLSRLDGYLPQNRTEKRDE